jgi:hypothetical protein
MLKREDRNVGKSTMRKTPEKATCKTIQNTAAAVSKAPQKEKLF